jgi:hypothetical protein
MTITFRITLPAFAPDPGTKQALRAVVCVAGPVLLAAVDSSGVTLPARLLLHTAWSAAQQALAAPGA